MTRVGELVFLSKQGKRLSAESFAPYWKLISASAGLLTPNAKPAFVPYLATKHRGVALLYEAGVSARTIGLLAGWSEREVQSMLRVYGHGDVAAQAEIDALYESLRAAEDFV